MSIIADLFLTFAKIGCFTFGGGYAMIALIKDACVDKKQWITHDEMMDTTVVAESTPGPMAINCATFVGYRQAGMLGATIATLGIVLPSFLIIFLISCYLEHFLEIGWIASAFQGIKIAIGILILNVGCSMLKKMKKKLFSYAIMGCSCAAMLAIDLFSLPVSAIAVMLMAAAVSLSAFTVKDMSHKRGAEK